MDTYGTYDYKNSDYEFSLMRDGVQETFHKMLSYSWNGKPPQGGLDTNATTAIGKVQMHQSNIHVDINWQSNDYLFSDGNDVDLGYTQDDYIQCPDDFQLSYDPMIVPKHRTQMPVSAESTPPFVFGEGDKNAPGMLGKALRAMGEACALMIEYNQDIDDYIQLFMRSWGLDQKWLHFVRSYVPQLRSHGPAMWGGIKRNLRPIGYAYGSAQAHLQVHQHSVQRKDFHPRALIDWPRINIIVRAIAGQLVVDDRVARGAIKRIDFAINPKEVPLAPNVVRIPKLNFIIPITLISNMNKAFEGTFQYIEHARQLNVERGQQQFSDTITFTNLDKVPEITPYLFGNKQLFKFMDLQTVFSEALDDFEYDIPNPTMHVRQEYKKITNYVTFLEQYIKSAVHSKIKTLPREFEINSYINMLDTQKTYKEGFTKLRKVIHQLIPHNFLNYVRVFGNLIERDQGMHWVVGLLHYLRTPDSTFLTRDLVDMLARTMTNESSLKIIAEQIQYAISSEMRLTKPWYTKRTFRLIANTKDVGIALNSVFNERKKVWSHRYYRNAVMEKRKGKLKNKRSLVKFQMLSKAFSKAKWIINEDEEITVDQENMAKFIMDSAANFIRKGASRMKHKNDLEKAKTIDEADNLPTFSYEDISRGLLDRHLMEFVQMNPTIPYQESLRDISMALDEFRADINRFLIDLTNADPDIKTPDVSDEEEIESEEEQEIEDEVEQVVTENAKKDKGPKKKVESMYNQKDINNFKEVFVVEPNKKDLFSANAFVANMFTVQTVDKSLIEKTVVEKSKMNVYKLKFEIRSEIPNISDVVIRDLLEEFGEMVPIDEWKNVINAAYEKMKLDVNLQHVIAADNIDIL